MVLKSKIAKHITCCAAASFILMGSAIVAQAQSALSSVESSGQLTVATEVAYPPMEFLVDGEVVGYGKDILDLVIADMDVELNQLQLPWDGILAGVLAKKYDMVATSVAINPERAAKYAFTKPLAVAQTMLIKRHGNDGLSDAADANGQIVGVELGSVQEQDVRAFDEQLIAQGGAGFAEIRGFKSNDDMRLALAGGQIDVGTIPSFALAPMMEQRPDTFAQFIVVGDGKLFAWVMHPDGTDLRDRVNDVIKRLEEDGTVAVLQQKWFGFTMDLPEDYLPEGAL